jgi:hypothetical protein
VECGDRRDGLRLSLSTRHRTFSISTPESAHAGIAAPVLLGQRQSFLIRGPGLSGPAQPAAHIRAGRMRQVPPPLVPVVVFPCSIFHPTASCQNSNCLTEGVHPTSLSIPLTSKPHSSPSFHGRYFSPELGRQFRAIPYTCLSSKNSEWRLGRPLRKPVWRPASSGRPPFWGYEILKKGARNS